MNGQKCVLHAISPNSRVIQAELLTEEKPHPILFITRINFTATVGRRGISFSRAQFSLRPAYAMTINKSQGQMLSRIGLDLRSSAFSHGHLYVSLSRAQNKTSIVCLLPPSQVVDGVPYTENIVYAPVIKLQQAFSVMHPLLPLLNLLLLPPVLRHSNLIGYYNTISELLPGIFSEIPNFTIRPGTKSTSTCLTIVTTATFAYMKAST